MDKSFLGEFDDDYTFLLDDEELKDVLFKDVLLPSEIDEFKKIANAKFLNTDKYNKLYKKISNELSKHEVKEINLHGITFIYSNEVEKYFAEKISLFDIDYNKFVDKKIKIICNKDINSKECIYHINSDNIIIKIGFMGDISKVSNKVLFVSEKPELRNSFINYSLSSIMELIDEDDPFLDNLRNLPNFKKIILLLLEKYEDEIAKELAADFKEDTKLSNEELIDLIFAFFKDTDKTGKMVNIFNDILDEGNLSVKKSNVVKTKDNISKLSSDENAYVDPISMEIVINSLGTTTDFIVLIHELLHYNSLKNDEYNSSRESSYFGEFPSIYFESLAKKYIVDKGMHSNFSVARNALSINSLYSCIFVVDLIELYFKNNLNNETINNLIDRYNISHATIVSLFKGDVLENFYGKLLYIVGILFTKYSFDHNVSSNTILDISTNLCNYSTEQVCDMIGLYDDIINKNNSVTR